LAHNKSHAQFSKFCSCGSHSINTLEVTDTSVAPKFPVSLSACTAFGRASFNQCNYFEVHAVPCLHSSLFKSLSGILAYKYATPCLIFTCRGTSGWCTSQFFIIIVNYLRQANLIKHTGLACSQF
jgi:hypothetical protein